MRLGQVFARRAFAFEEIGHGVDSKSVDAPIQPEGHDLENLLLDGGIVVVQVGLMRIKAVPEILLRDRVPRPIRLLGVLENDPHALIFLVRVAPDVVIAVRRIGVFREPPGTRDAGRRCDSGRDRR